MKLYIDGCTKEKLFSIDHINARFDNGKEIAVLYEENDQSINANEFSARFKGVEFDEVPEFESFLYLQTHLTELIVVLHEKGSEDKTFHYTEGDVYNVEATFTNGDVEWDVPSNIITID